MSRVFYFVIYFISVFVQASESETIWLENEKVLACSPDQIKVGESVHLKLGQNHGKELAVYREAEELWLFLVVGTQPQEMESLLSPSEFEHASNITISPSTTGFRWDAKGGNEPVFETPGKYTIYVSENLESEIGGYKCGVTVANY